MEGRRGEKGIGYRRERGTGGKKIGRRENRERLKVKERKEKGKRGTTEMEGRRGEKGEGERKVRHWRK